MHILLIFHDKLIVSPVIKFMGNYIFYQSNILQISEKKILVLFAADAFNLNNLPNEDPWRPEIPEGLSNIILSIVLVSLMKISIPTRTGNQY